MEFEVGVWVWLRLLHRTTQSLDPRARQKLGPRWAGLFGVLERIGSVAYRLHFRKAPAYMMSSTSASSSSITATLQGRRVPFLRHRMAALCLSLSAFCSPSSGEVHGTS